MTHFFLIDSQQAVFDADGKSLKIRPQSYEVFSILLESENSVVSRSHLLDTVWGPIEVTDDSISQCIADIRRVLGPQHRHLLQTVPKKGYRLSAGVSSLNQPIIVKTISPPVARPTVPKISKALPDDSTPLAAIARHRSTTIIAGILITVVASVYAYRFFTAPNRSPEDLHTIAVLPFKNLSSDRTDDYLSNGTTEDLITDLSTLSGLRVISRTTVYAYVDRTLENQQAIANDMGVRYIINGSVRRSDSKIRINVELTDTESEAQLWADRYDGEVSNIFDLQDRISRSVVEQLALKLTVLENKRLKQKTTENLEAYSLYQQGRSYTFSNQRELGQEYLRKAAVIDPNFSNAIAALAFSHGITVSFGQSDDIDKELDTAFKLATKAVSMDHHSAEANVALAQTFLLKGKHKESIHSAKRAIDNNPSYAPALIMHGWANALSGDYANALDSLSRAVVLQPASNGMVLTVLGSTYYLAGRYDEAATILEESISINPNVLTSRVFLTATYQKLGRLDDAEWEAQETLALNPEFKIGEWRWGRIFKYKDRSEYQHLLRDLQASGLPMG